MEAIDDMHRVPRGEVAGKCSLEGSEELIGLGSYGETLTVLTVAGLEERITVREELHGSWAPRCGRRCGDGEVTAQVVELRFGSG